MMFLPYAVFAAAFRGTKSPRREVSGTFHKAAIGGLCNAYLRSKNA
jgi:hypothetical protein